MTNHPGCTGRPRVLVWQCCFHDRGVEVSTVVSIRVEVFIEADAADVWAAFADVGAVHRRLLPGRVTDVRLDGDLRTLVMADGVEVRELIVAIDHDDRRLAYSVQGGQRMALTHHHASFQVFADAAGSRLVWITDVLPHALEPQVRARVERGAVEMKHVIENATKGDGG